MVERDYFENPEPHHGRGHAATPRNTDSDDVNSRTPEPDHRQDGEHRHHEEENQNQERNTEMKRTGTILSSLAIAIMFVCTVSANAASLDNRNQRDIDDRTNARVDNRPDARYDNRLRPEFGYDYGVRVASGDERPDNARNANRNRAADDRLDYRLADDYDYRDRTDYNYRDRNRNDYRERGDRNRSYDRPVDRPDYNNYDNSADDRLRYDVNRYDRRDS